MPFDSSFWQSRHKNSAGYSFTLVVVVAMACTGVLASVHTLLADAFAQADLRLDEAAGGEQRALIFPDAVFEKVDAPAIDGLRSVYRASTGGYVFDVVGSGYAGEVVLMVGISADGKIAGIQVGDHKETNGIGTNALSEQYLKSFVGMPAVGALTIDDAASGEVKVDAVSGATFTSKAVVSCLNIAFEAYAQIGGSS